MRLSRHETKFKGCFQIAQVINTKTNQINSSAASVALNQFSNWKKRRDMFWTWKCTVMDQ